MKKIVLIILLCFISAVCFADVLTFQTKDYTYKLDTGHGGHIVSMIDKDGVEWLNGNFMLLDFVTQQDYQQGDLKNVPYEYTTKTEGTKTYITLWNFFKTRSVAGLKLTKTISFDTESNIVHCDYELFNPTDHNIKAGLWIQNIVTPNNCEVRATYRPSTKGTVEYTYPYHEAYSFYNMKADFTFNMTQGFIGVKDNSSQKGIIFLPDYNYLKCIYSNQGGFTQEWWYNDTLIKPNFDFKQSFNIIPITSLDRYDFASNNYVMSKKIQRDGSISNFTINVLSLNDYKDKKVKITAKKYPEMTLLSETEGTLTDKITELSLNMDNLDSHDDIVYNVYFDTNESYEAFSPGVAILFTETDYKIKAPKKIKNIVKPEFTQRTVNEKINILQARGLFSNKYLFKEIAQNKYDYSEALYYSTDLGSGLNGFPEDYDEIFKYDLVIFNHIPYNAMTEDSWDFMKDYVTYGGKILFIGGPMTITGFDPDDVSQILVPFSYRDFSKIKKVNKKLENCGKYEYEIQLNSKDLIKVTDYLYKKDIGSGSLYFFTPTVLSQKMEKEGFWNNENYTTFMDTLINKIVR